MTLHLEGLGWHDPDHAALLTVAVPQPSKALVRLLPFQELAFGSSPELCVKVRGSSSMLLLGCLGDLLRFEKREIQVATFAPGRSSP